MRENLDLNYNKISLSYANLFYYAFWSLKSHNRERESLAVFYILLRIFMFKIINIRHEYFQAIPKIKKKDFSKLS
jgi:hypothetical protein